MAVTASRIRSGLILTMTLCVLTTSVLPTVSHAETYNVFDDVEKATLTIHGKEITFPIGNVERKQDVYLLKRALAGDNEAREMFLGGNKDKWFFVGTESPVWLKVSLTGEEIVIPK